MIKRYLLARSRNGFFIYDYRRTSGHSQRPSGHSPCSALFVARSLEHRSFERCHYMRACITASTSLPSPERESHSTLLLVDLFERISIILHTHHAICTIHSIVHIAWCVRSYSCKKKKVFMLLFIISEYKI